MQSDDSSRISSDSELTHSEIQSDPTSHAPRSRRWNRVGLVVLLSLCVAGFATWWWTARNRDADPLMEVLAEIKYEDLQIGCGALNEVNQASGLIRTLADPECLPVVNNHLRDSAKYLAAHYILLGAEWGERFPRPPSFRRWNIEGQWPLDHSKPSASQEDVISVWDAWWREARHVGQ